MPGRKASLREFSVLAGLVLGGFVAVTIGPWLSDWVNASQEHARITIAVGAVIGGAIAWLATRTRAQA
jgi:hypothetical protein